MADHEPRWDLYRSFLAVMREGSLSAAARAQGMTQPSLGRHVRDLEAALGVALFTRSPHGLIPTDKAHELLPHAQAMAAATASLRRVAATDGEAVRGVVRITASEIMGAEVLPAMLAAFREAHPAVVIELSLSDQAEDLLRRDADLAVRTFRPDQKALVTRKAGQVVLGTYAHRDYVQRHSQPSTVAELADHVMIGFDHEPAYVRRMRPPGFPYARELFSLRTDSDLAALAALRAGYGIGMCQVPLAARDANLVRLLPAQVAIGMDVWLVMHEDLRRSPVVRALFDHLVTAFGGYVHSVS
ncbi:MAG TPA: LysR family transcriptional regulator [Oleiagrimonas sp.]|nr:LysR family transcriptional regulator [Oleiagrimonas sp.]